ncbi:MAG: SagB/ThcOx family dehydrogenase [Desulfatibacillaceae bacterium]
MDDDTHGVGDAFHKGTVYVRGQLPGGHINLASQPKPYKEYPDAPRKTLPTPKPEKKGTVEEALRKRHSVRKYRDEPVSVEEMSFLLWATAGVNRVERGMAFRTAPSAGALYPVETYLVVRQVEGVPPGLYHYFPLTHALEGLQKGDFANQAAKAALDQRMPATAAATFVFSAVFGRTTWKYKQRGYRYIYMDCGHMAQNMALAATSLGLGTCQIGAIYDKELNALFGLDGNQESAIYMSTVGHPG